MRKKFSIIIRILLIFWLLLIFTMSSFSPSTSNSQSSFIINLISPYIKEIPADLLTFIVRKSAHFLEYAILGILFYLNFRQLNSANLQKELISDKSTKNTIKTKIKSFISAHPAISAALSSLLYATTDEFHQLFVPGRSGKISDVIIDFSGSVTGIIIILVLTKYGKMCYNKLYGVFRFKGSS